MGPLNFRPMFKPLESTLDIYKERLAKENELKESAKGFESILITSMVKQGLKTAREISESDDDSSNKYLDMAYDQLATYMGENMNLGLADMIFENMKDRL